MDLSVIQPRDTAYPAGIEECLGRRPALTALGNRDLIRCRPLALFWSIKCPGDVILRTYDFIRALRDAGVPTIGGFRSPREKECLDLLLRGSQPVIVCRARSIDGMRISSAWKKPIAAGRLLVLSPFADKHPRITAERSQVRNLFVAALAEQVFVGHAGPGSKTEALARQVQTWGKPLWTLESDANTALGSLGAQPLGADDVSQLEDEDRKSGRSSVPP